MDLSIIIPVYNTAQKDLSRCFATLRFPEHITFEVILVDDGSQNETAELCRDYAAAHAGFRYYRQENRGVSAARNAGLSLASGRYVMFVDADDALIPSAMTREQLHGHWDIIFFDYEQWEDTGVVQQRIFAFPSARIPEREDFFLAACENRLNSVCSKLFRRELLLENGIRFDETMVVAEDACFVLDALLAAKYLCHCDDLAYRYYHSYGNGDARLLREPVKVLENLICFYRHKLETLEKSGMLRNAGAAGRMVTAAAIGILEDVFNSVGVLLLKGTCPAESDGLVAGLLAGIPGNCRRQLPLKTKLKYVLLRADLKLLIKWLAVLRERYLAGKLY